MKHILSLLVLASSTAFACPKLSGHYSACKTVEGSYPDSGEHEVMQRMNGNVTVFHISAIDPNSNERTTDTYIADGKWYSQEMIDAETGAVLTYATQATCSGDFLKIVTKLSSDEVEVVISKTGSKVTQKISGVNLGQQVEAVQFCE